MMENNYFDCFVTMKRWLENRNRDKKWSSYFQEYGYQTIAIYGAGDIGRLLYEELKESAITVLYFVDRNAEGLNDINGIPVITPEEIIDQPKVDTLVISPLGDYFAISEALTRLMPELSTLSLKDAVYEI